MAKIQADKKYHIVSALDIEELLPFVKKETRSLTEEIAEEKRVKKELVKFVELLKKHTKEKLYYIGEEKKLGKHLERFIFHNGGFLEVVIESPVTINAHFIDKKRAQNFYKGLRKTSKFVLPESKVKQIFIDSIKVGKPDDIPLTFDKWNLLNRLSRHSTAVFTIVALIIVLMFEAIQTLTEHVSSTIFNFDVHRMFIVVANAVFIALFFEPIKIKVSRIVDKYLSDKK